MIAGGQAPEPRLRPWPGRAAAGKSDGAV